MKGRTDMISISCSVSDFLTLIFACVIGIYLIKISGKAISNADKYLKRFLPENIYYIISLLISLTVIAYAIYRIVNG